MRKFLVKLGATFFFTGYFPVAPATFASAVTLAAWYFLGAGLSPLAMLGLIVFVTAIGIPLATRAEPIFGHDGKPIVIDEVAGALLTVAWMGPSGTGHSLPLAIAGFLVFRVLDVVKPPPAYQLQSLPKGWGVMMDDIMAAIYGNLLLRGVMLLWPTLLAAPPAR